MDERLLARAVRAWKLTWLWLNRDGKDPGSQQTYKVETADEVLSGAGITIADPERYLRWEREVRTRALAAIQAEGLGKPRQGYSRMSGRRIG